MFRRSVLALAMSWAMTGFLPANADAIVLTTGSTGGGATQSTIQPSLALNPLIRTQGAFETLGEVTFFGGNRVPSGWAEANGQLLTISGNPSLFAVLGTIYGGDGRTNFGLPDLRGRVAIGDGNGPGLTPKPIGQKSGVENVALPLPTHDHALLTPPGGNTDPAGGGLQKYTNMQPSLGLNYVMPLQGVIPTGSTVPSEPTLGFVELYASQDFNLPSGYVSADGQLLPISSNTDLFALLGKTYGGGATTFGLPDLRGRTVIGVGTGPGLPLQTLGQKSGVEKVDMSEAEMASHNHTLDPSDPSFPLTTDTTGGDQPQTNMQPTLALQYLVALNGSDPTTSGDDPFTGEIGLFAGIDFGTTPATPGGWLPADGRLLSIASFLELFAVLGTIYGGDGRTNFGLPDLRGMLALGDGTGPGLMNWKLGQESGVESLTMTVAQMTAHTHTYAVSEPSALAIFAFGLAGLGVMRRRNRKRTANS